jgi:hypothetical protein
MPLGVMTRTLAAGALAVAAAMLLSTPSLAAGRDCSVAAIQAASPRDTTIVSADREAKPAALCKVEGYVATNDPTPNKVNFRLQLPDDFKGRYYLIGMGGSAGYVPSDSQIPAGNPVYKGFAVAGTDTGHQGYLLDWDFIAKNPAQRIDHAHRGAHVVAVATQAITRDYYGVSKIYRYFSGCSGGGRMATMAIERHPEDFDGVLDGAPGGRSSGTDLKFIQVYQEMIREPGSWVSPAKLAMIEKHVTDACDLTDGAKDGVVWDHRLCHFDVATLQCKSGDGPDCLTVPEIKSVKAILAGPHGPKGELIAHGMPITNTSTWSGFLGSVPPPWSPAATGENMAKSSAAYVIGSTMANVYLGFGYDIGKFNFKSQKDLDAWWASNYRLDFGQPYTANLRGVQKAGHKVIFWNGVSDPCCSNVELEQYYLDAAKQVGGRDALSKFAALYQVPGNGHCGGGTGPQDAPDVLLQQLVAWVEKGEHPGAAVAHRGADRVQLLFSDPQTKTVSGVIVAPPVGGSRDFLLCPFPSYSLYKGHGDVMSAANWSCHTPQPGEKRQG